MDVGVLALGLLILYARTTHAGSCGSKGSDGRYHIQTLDGNCDPAVAREIVKRAIGGAPGADPSSDILNQRLAKTTSFNLEQGYASKKLEFSVVVYTKAGGSASDPIQPGSNDGAVTTCQLDQLAKCFTTGSGSFWVGNMVSHDEITRSAVVFFHRQGEAVFSLEVVSAFQESAAACLEAVPTVMDTVAGCINSQNAGNRGVLVTPEFVRDFAYDSKVGLWSANHVLVFEKEFPGLTRKAGNKVVVFVLPAST